jgi:hypothetical protein
MAGARLGRRGRGRWWPPRGRGGRTVGIRGRRRREEKKLGAHSRETECCVDRLKKRCIVIIIAAIGPVWFPAYPLARLARCSTVLFGSVGGLVARLTESHFVRLRWLPRNARFGDLRIARLGPATRATPPWPPKPLNISERSHLVALGLPPLFTRPAALALSSHSPLTSSPLCVTAVRVPAGGIEGEGCTPSPAARR